MKNIKFFKDKLHQKYAMSELPIVCSQCEKECFQFLILKQYFYKGHVKRFVCCSNECAKKISFIGDVEVGSYLITNEIERDFSFIQPEKLEFQHANKLSIFEAANLDCRTNDKTVHAGRFSLEGASVGNVEAIEECKAKDKSISYKEADNLLLDLKNSKFADEEERVKRLAKLEKNLIEHKK